LSVDTTQSSWKFTSHDGCRLQVHRWGKSGPACILLHGFGEGSYIWEDFAPANLAKYQSIVVDLRGHGDSESDPSRRYQLDSYVKDIELLIDELDLKRFAIVGHSLGGLIAIHVAAARPEQVLAVVIVESGPLLRREALARIRADFRESHRIYPTIAEYTDWLRQRRVLVSAEKMSVLAARSLRRRFDGRFEPKADLGIADQAEPPEAEAALWKAVAKVVCPTLVLRGAASSVLAHEAALRTMLAFRQAQLSTINRAGHGLIVENAKAFADVVRVFLNEAAIGVAAQRVNSQVDCTVAAGGVREDVYQPMVRCN
jgi:pimeloyl-ACP methyl ester carboxylesterase